MKCLPVYCRSLILLPLLGLVACTPAPVASAPAAETPAASAATEPAQGVYMFSPDRTRVLFSSNKTGTWNAYTRPRESDAWTAVTTSTTHDIYALAWFPADDRMLVTHDPRSSESSHLYVIETDGSETELTPDEGFRVFLKKFGVNKFKARFVEFNTDGSAFYVSTNERDTKSFDLYRYDAKTYRRSRVYENRKGDEIGPISPDERWVLLTGSRTAVDNNLYLYDSRTQTKIDMTPHKGDVLYWPLGFTEDSGSVTYESHIKSDDSRLNSYVIATGKHEDLGPTVLSSM